MDVKSGRASTIFLQILSLTLLIICIVGILMGFSLFWSVVLLLLSVIIFGLSFLNAYLLSRKDYSKKPIVVEFNPEDEEKPWSEYVSDLESTNPDHSDIPYSRPLDDPEDEDKEEKGTTRHTFNTWSGEVDSPTPRLRGNWPTWGIGTEYDKAVVINDATYVVNTHTGIGIEVVPDTYEPVVSEVMDENGKRYYSYTGIQIIK